MKVARKRQEFQGIPVDLLAPVEILEQVKEWLDQPGLAHQIVTLNGLMLLESLENPGLAKVIRGADLVTLDGYGVAAALKRHRQQVPERLPGVTLVQKLLEHCSEGGYSVFFYGGTSRLIESLRPAVARRWPGVIPVFRDGFSGGDLLQEIRNARPRLILAGLGSPKQEMFLAEILQYLPGTVGIGVGGSFEVLAGLKREAPDWLRQQGWEWLFRLAQDPRRVSKLPRLLKFWWKYLWHNG